MAINMAYKNADKMSLTMTLDMYETYTSKKLYFSQRVEIKKMGKNIFQSSEESQVISTPNYSVLKDDEEKVISYMPKKTTVETNDIDFMMDLDSIGQFCKSFKFAEENDKLRSYDFIMQDQYPDYNRIKIFFNSKSHFIEKMIFFCEEDDISVNNEEERFEKARVEISYQNIDTKPDLKEVDFTYQRYLVKQGSKFELKPAFKNYELSVMSF